MTGFRKWRWLRGHATTLTCCLPHHAFKQLRRRKPQVPVAFSGPALAGSRVDVLDETLAPVPLSEAALGLEANWRVGPASKPVSDRSYRALNFTPEGVGLRPFSVGHVEQPWRKAREPGDLVISWTRRSRALAADSWTAPDVPLAEETEAYEVEVLDGGTVTRTLSTSTTSVTYSAAQQLADRGALLGPGDAPDLRIFQLSAVVGRARRQPSPCCSECSHVHQHPSAAAVPGCGAGAEARHRQRGAAVDRHLTAAPASSDDVGRYVVASGATGLRRLGPQYRLRVTAPGCGWCRGPGGRPGWSMRRVLSPGTAARPSPQACRPSSPTPSGGAPTVGVRANDTNIHRGPPDGGGSRELARLRQARCRRRRR